MENQPGISLKNLPHFRDCVQWSEDGILAICLDSIVHIITPILVDISSKEDSYKHVGFSLPELKEADKGAEVVNIDNLDISYANEEGFRCANWSQTGISKTQSCLLAVVTTKHRVLLYQSSFRNPINSDWQLYADITENVKENSLPHEHPTKRNLHHTLYASWSNNLVSDPLATKLSFLALTNKAGDVSIWIVDHEGVKYSSTVTPHSSFVNLLDWTDWKKSEDGNSNTAYFVSSSSNGTVALSSVTVKTKVEGLIATVEDIQVKTLNTWFADDVSMPTVLKIHDDFENNSPFVRIAVCKGTTVWFNCLSVADDAMEEDSTWKPYYSQHSALGLTAGSWINDFDFKCYTVEGECLLLHFGADGEVALNEAKHRALNNKLYRKYKQQWADEQNNVDEDDLIQASDAFPYIWGAGDSLNHTFTALYYTMRPAIDIHFRPDSSEESNLTFILQKPRGLDSESTGEIEKSYVNDPYFFFTKPVMGLMREYMAYIVEDDNLEPLLQWMTKLSNYLDVDSVFDGNNLTKSIYCQPSSIASRLITNTELHLKSFKFLRYEDGLEIIYAQARNHTMEQYLNCIFTFALQLPDEKFTQFNEEDKMSLLVLADLALLKNSAKLNQNTLDIYVKLQDKFPNLNLYEEIAYLSSPEGPFKVKAREKCPVCDEMVQSIDGGTIAQCNAGHFWELCGITRRVLFSPSTRKCSFCGIKSLLPSNDGSLTDIIISHCVRCIYCGAGLQSS